MSVLRENLIEKKLVEMARKCGGFAPKFVSPGWDGVPDRIILLPEGRIGFIETKRYGKKMRPLQERRKHQLEALGFRVWCVNSPEQIGGVIDEIQAT